MKNTKLDIEKKIEAQDVNYKNEELKGKKSFLPDLNLKSSTANTIYIYMTSIQLSHLMNINMC